MKVLLQAAANRILRYELLQLHHVCISNNHKVFMTIFRGSTVCAELVLALELHNVPLDTHALPVVLGSLSVGF